MMKQNHEPATVQIYRSKDYGRFKIIDGNRVISSKKVNNLIKDINSGLDLLKYNPITVTEGDNNRLNIIDGQHRYFTSKTLKTFVYYTVVPQELSIPDIAKINSNSDRWKKIDYINAFSRAGDEHYTILQDFMHTWNCSFSVAVKLLTTGRINKAHGQKDTEKRMFERGVMRCDFVNEANALMRTASKFRFFAYWKTRDFLMAIEELIKVGKVDWEVMVEKCTQHQERMSQKAGHNEYLVMLEELYNKGVHNRKTIF